MPQQSFESSLSSPAATAAEYGPLLEGAQGSADAGHTLRIRARRSYTCSADDLFAAWTSRVAWERWMRLRAKSRASIAACRGGAFRLELAEGPTIHVVTGTVLTLHEPDHVRLSWQHLQGNKRMNVVDVTIRPRLERTELVFTHSDIASRRDAAWHMRLWAMTLRRLGDHVVAEASHSVVLRRRMIRLVASGAVARQPSSPP